MFSFLITNIIVILVMIIREAGGVVVDPTTGGEVDFLARCTNHK